MTECINGNCEITESSDYRAIKPLPEPTEEDRKEPLFDPIWKVLYGKRLYCSEYYEGWQIATGQHVKVIIDMIKEAR